MTLTDAELVRRRLFSQRLAANPIETPAGVVGWLGAVQAQEPLGAKWGIAQRMDGATESLIDETFARGDILRTHVMRPTWHFVTPADIRWLLRLTAPRVNRLNAYYYRKLDLDESFFVQSHDVLTRALEGGKHLTRPELAAVLEGAGLLRPEDDRLRLAYIIMRAELDGLLCSGAMRGKQHTYALLDERVPESRALGEEEALAELITRYFASHGPATVKDCSWWSGLTMTQVREGLALAGARLAEARSEGESYWFSPGAPTAAGQGPRVHLLPAFDEYTIAYKDHRAVLDPEYKTLVDSALRIVIVIDGRIAGGWKRTFRRGAVVVEVHPFAPLPEQEREAITEAAYRYGAYLELPVVLEWREM